MTSATSRQISDTLRSFVDRGECSQIAYSIVELIRDQLHDMTPPKCSYTRPDEKDPSPSIRIYWTRQHQRLSLYINQEGTIQIFKYRNDLGRDIGFMFPGTNSLGTHDFAIEKIRQLLTKPTRSFPPKNTSIFHFYVVPRGTNMPQSARLIGEDETLTYYELNSVIPGAVPEGF